MAANVTVVAEAQNQVDYFNFTVGVWIPGVICLLGICGNLLSLVVLSLDRGKNPTFYSLRALAVSDILLLGGAMMQQVIPMYCENMELEDSFSRIRGYFQVYSWPVICIAQMASIWFTVIISAERYLAVCRPLDSVHIRTMSKVRMAILLVVITSILYNIPKFFEFQPVERTNEKSNLTYISWGVTLLRSNVVYRYLYNLALFCLVIYAVPLVILTFLNVRIIGTMRRSSKAWDSLNRKQQRELKATVMPLCVVIVFIICGSQSLAAFILDAIFVHGTHKWLQVYTAVVNLMVMINSAVNFLIFYLFGRKFRFLLKRLLQCRDYHHKHLLTRQGWRNRPIH